MCSFPILIIFIIIVIIIIKIDVLLDLVPVLTHPVAMFAPFYRPECVKVSLWPGQIENGYYRI